MRTPWLSSFLALAACSSPTIDSGATWRVGSDLDNPPFAWVDEDGVARGRDVEMARELAREMDVLLEWRRMAFADLLGSLEAGEVDAVIATLGATPARAERVLLSTPYYFTDLRAVARRGQGQPKDLSELADRVVSAGTGTTSELALRLQLPAALPAPPAPKGSTSVDRLMSGEVDAVVMDGPDARDLVREWPREFVLLEPALAEEHYVVAVRPDGKAWLLGIDGALEALRERGFLAELDRRFQLTPVDAP